MVILLRLDQLQQMAVVLVVDNIMVGKMVVQVVVVLVTRDNLSDLELGDKETLVVLELIMWTSQLAVVVVVLEVRVVMQVVLLVVQVVQVQQILLVDLL